MELKSLKDIPSSFLLAKRALMVCLIVSAVTTIGSLSWAYMMSQTFKNSAYILSEDGSAAFAKGLTTNGIDNYRRPEIINHSKTFHHLFWGIDQFKMDRNIEKALNLIGESGKSTYLTLKASGYYANIVSQNLEQEMKIDSIHVNDEVTPYQVALYAKVIVNRTDQRSKSVTNFTSTFTVHNVSRTENNPHGLLIENYQPKTSPIKK